jgi:hypothetical protein
MLLARAARAGWATMVPHRRPRRIALGNGGGAARAAAAAVAMWATRSASSIPVAGVDAALEVSYSDAREGAAGCCPRRRRRHRHRHLFRVVTAAGAAAAAAAAALRTHARARGTPTKFHKKQTWTPNSKLREWVRKHVAQMGPDRVRVVFSLLY